MRGLYFNHLTEQLTVSMLCCREPRKTDRPRSLEVSVSAARHCSARTGIRRGQKRKSMAVDLSTVLVEPTKLLLIAVLATTTVYFITFVINLHLRVRRMSKVVADMPCPSKLPFVGTIYEITKNDEVYYNIQRNMMNFKGIGHAWIGTELFVTIGDPRDVEFVCTNQKLIDKSWFYEGAVDFLGRGVSVLNTPEIRRHRKIVIPSMHLDILRDFLETFTRKSNEFADSFEKYAGTGETFEITKITAHYALSAAIETIMASDLDDNDPKKVNFFECVWEAIDVLMYRIFHPWFMNETVFMFSSFYNQWRRNVKVINAFTDELIIKKRRQIQNGTNGGQKKTSRAFLDKVLSTEGGQSLNNEELRDEVKTLLCTGYETTASTTNFLLLAMALRQDIQEKVMEEIDLVFGNDRQRPITADDLVHLEYMERVIKETMRMFPVFPLFARNTPCDLQLPNGYTVPKGAHLMFWLPYTHRDPDNWPDPGYFDPNRFLPENLKTRHPYSYAPFSAGPRNCVGQRYAMMSLKTELCTLLRRLKLLPAPGDENLQLDDVHLRYHLVLMVKGGVNLRVERRQPPRQKAVT